MTDTTRERVARTETAELERGLAAELLKRLREPGGTWAPSFDEVEETILFEALSRMAAVPRPSVQREVYTYRDGVMNAEMEPVPQSASGKVCCILCETPLDLPGRPWTRSCGGDCLACMADVGDPDCVAAMAAMQGGGWRPIPTDKFRGGLGEVLVRSYYPNGRTMSDVYHAWPTGDLWARWPHPFPPTHYMEIEPLPAAPTLPSQTEETDHA